MENYSGLVNTNDASNHGAAVIYGGNSGKSAVDEYLDRVGTINKTQELQNRQYIQQSEKDNAAILKEVSKVWTPYSESVNNMYNDWQKAQGAALLEKNTSKKYQAQAQADLLMSGIITAVSKSEQEKKSAEIVEREMIMKPQNFTPEEVDYHNQWKARTDAAIDKDNYISPTSNKKDNFLKIIQKPSIKPSLRNVWVDTKVGGTDVKEYFDQYEVTPSQVEDAYNAISMVPDMRYARDEYIAEQIKTKNITADEADKGFKNYVTQSWLASLGMTKAKKDDQGNIEYYYNQKHAYTAPDRTDGRSTAATFDTSGYDYQYYNKAGNIELVKENGYIRPSYSNQGNQDIVSVNAVALTDYITKGDKTKLKQLGDSELQINSDKGIFKTADGTYMNVSAKKPTAGQFDPAQFYSDIEIKIADKNGNPTGAYSLAKALFHDAIKIKGGEVVPDKNSSYLRGSRGFGEYDKSAPSEAPKTQSTPSNNKTQKKATRKKYDAATGKLIDY